MLDFKLLNQRKQDLGLVRHQMPLASFEVKLPRESIAQFQELSAYFVEGLARMAFYILKGHPHFPTLGEMGFSKQKSQLLLHNLPQHHRELLVIGRLDVTTNGQQFLTYEFNGSQPGGMEFLALFDHPMFQALENPPPIAHLYQQYLQNALYLYGQKMGQKEPAGILLLGHNYHLIDVQREMLERALGRPIFLATNGANCKWQDNTLYYAKTSRKWYPIDLVIRSPRASFEVLMEKDNASILRAWRKGRLVLVNPPHAKLVGWKTLYVYLQREKLLDLAGVTDQERHAIQQMLPKIEVVHPGNAERLKATREQWVLKYTLRGRGTMVWLGPELAQNEWEKRIDHAAARTGWVCQQFAAPFCMDIHVHDPSLSRYYVPTTIDPYVTFGETTSTPGFLCRAVVPTHHDNEELQHVKLNLLGTNLYKGDDGEVRERKIGFGYLSPSD